MSKLMLKNVAQPLLSFGLGAILFSLAPEAFSAEPNKPTKEYSCENSECKTEEGLIFRVKSKGESTATA